MYRLSLIIIKFFIYYAQERFTGIPPEKHSGVQRILGLEPTYFFESFMASSNLAIVLKPIPRAKPGFLAPTT